MELIRIASMLEKLENRCAEAYQVVGSLARTAQFYHDPAVVKALDLLSQSLRKGDILRFSTKKDEERSGQ